MLKLTNGSSLIIKYRDENATTEKGKKRYIWLKHEHSVVLLGYNDNNYIVNNPYQIKDKVLGQYQKQLYEKKFIEMWSEVLILKTIINENNINNN